MMLERLPNRVDMERFLECRQPSYLHQAQEQADKLIDAAVELSNPVQQNAFAMGAIANYPPAADAFVILARNASTPAASLELYRRGVEAGELSLGKAMFEREKGFFWGVMETRPYMRARLGLAHALWTVGREEEAIGHLRELIKLNPRDNQGVRHVLAAYLSERGEFEELGQLLDTFDWDEGLKWYLTQYPMVHEAQTPGMTM